MPRTHRGMPHRYAGLKSKKRRRQRAALLSTTPTPTTAASSSIIEDLEEADSGFGLGQAPFVPRSAISRPAQTPSSPKVERRIFTTSRQRVSSRKPFSAFAEEYRYVAKDIRRVFVVAGSLLLVLIALSFVIR